MAFFQEMLQKSQFEEEKQVFSFKMVHQYAKEAVLLMAECCFLLMKQSCESTATELLEFFEEMEQDFLKKHKNFEFGQRITYVLGCNTIRWTKIAR